MKSPAKLLFALAATGLAFVGSAQAQIITNTNTHAGYSSSAITFSSFGNTLYQTFSNVSAVHSMTFNFFSTSMPAAGSTFTATFGQWNGSSIIGGTDVSFGTVTVPPTTTTGTGSGVWNDYSGSPIGNFSGISAPILFDFTTLSDPLINPTFGYLSNSANTYAMVITQTGGPNTLALGANFTDPLQTSLVGFNGSTNLGSADWVFSQLSVYAGNQQLVPVPESSTVAGIAGAVLVGGLVTLRLRQRRQLAPVAPLAA